MMILWLPLLKYTLYSRREETKKPGKPNKSKPSYTNKVMNLQGLPCEDGQIFPQLQQLSKVSGPFVVPPEFQLQQPSQVQGLHQVLQSQNIQTLPRPQDLLQGESEIPLTSDIQSQPISKVQNLQPISYPGVQHSSQILPKTFKPHTPQNGLHFQQLQQLTQSIGLTSKFRLQQPHQVQLLHQGLQPNTAQLQPTLQLPQIPQSYIQQESQVLPQLEKLMQPTGQFPIPPILPRLPNPLAMLLTSDMSHGPPITIPQHAQPPSVLEQLLQSPPIDSLHQQSDQFPQPLVQHLQNSHPDLRISSSVEQLLKNQTDRSKESEAPVVVTDVSPEQDQRGNSKEVEEGQDEQMPQIEREVPLSTMSGINDIEGYEMMDVPYQGRINSPNQLLSPPEPAGARLGAAGTNSDTSSPTSSTPSQVVSSPKVAHSQQSTVLFSVLYDPSMTDEEDEAWKANLNNFRIKYQEVEREGNALEVAKGKLREMNETFKKDEECLAKLDKNITEQEAKQSEQREHHKRISALEQTQKKEVEDLEKEIRENTESVRRATEEQEQAKKKAEESEKAARDQTLELKRQTQRSNDGRDSYHKLLGYMSAMNSPDIRDALNIFSEENADKSELKKKNEALDGLNVKMKQLEEQLGAITEKLTDSTNEKNKIESEKAKIETSIKIFVEEKLKIKSNLYNLKKEKKELEDTIQNEEEEINEGRKEVLVLQQVARCFKIGSMEGTSSSEHLAEAYSSDSAQSPQNYSSPSSSHRPSPPSVDNQETDDLDVPGTDSFDHELEATSQRLDVSQLDETQSTDALNGIDPIQLITNPPDQCSTSSSSLSTPRPISSTTTDDSNLSFQEEIRRLNQQRPTTGRLKITVPKESVLGIHEYRRSQSGIEEDQPEGVVMGEKDKEAEALQSATEETGEEREQTSDEEELEEELEEQEETQQLMDTQGPVEGTSTPIVPKRRGPGRPPKHRGRKRKHVEGDSSTSSTSNTEKRRIKSTQNKDNYVYPTSSDDSPV